MDKSVNKFKIFIVDDSVFVRNSLMDLLPELGFDIVGMAASAKNAFRYVADTRPDVVLLDISIPNIAAEDVIRGLLAINPNLEIIILAPLTNQSEISKLMKYGADDFIPKPLVPRQVEYVLRTYELSAGIKPQTEIQQIAQIHALFYNECLKHATENIFQFIHKSIHDPLKRLNKKYPERYKIEFDPIYIECLQAIDTHTRNTYLMYKVQLDRLYYSIARRLDKEFPREYVFSFLNEAYQTFYPMAIYLIDATNYNLPKWEGFETEYYDPNYQYHRSIQQVYEREPAMVWPNLPNLDINKRLNAYRTVVHHDPRLVPKFPQPDRRKVEDLDIHVILSYFDDIMGPIAGIILPPPHGRLEKDKLDAIPRLMDTVGSNNTFIHSISDYGSVNTMFSVPLDVRGGVRDYMLSVVINPAEVQEMVKVNQMSSLITVSCDQIRNFYKSNPELARSDLKLSNQPEKILVELLGGVRENLKS